MVENELDTIRYASNPEEEPLSPTCECPSNVVQELKQARHLFVCVARWFGYSHCGKTPNKTSRILRYIIFILAAVTAVFHVVLLADIMYHCIVDRNKLDLTMILRVSWMIVLRLLGLYCCVLVIRLNCAAGQNVVSSVMCRSFGLVEECYTTPGALHDPHEVAKSLTQDFARFKQQILCYALLLGVPVLFVLCCMAAILMGATYYYSVSSFGFISSSWIKVLSLCVPVVVVFNTVGLGNVLVFIARLPAHEFLKKLNNLAYVKKKILPREIRLQRHRFQMLVDILTNLNGVVCDLYLLFNITYALCTICYFGAFMSREQMEGRSNTVRLALFASWNVAVSFVFLATNIVPISLNEQLFKFKDVLNRVWRLQNETVDSHIDGPEASLWDEIDREFAYLLTSVANTSIGIKAGQFYYISRRSCVTILSLVITYIVVVLQIHFTKNKTHKLNC